MAFVVDIETTGVRSNAGVLSLAIAYFGVEDEAHNLDYLKENSLSLKFNLEEQINKFNRTIDKSTVEWWKKQTEEVKKISLYPNENDISVIDGIKQINEFIKTHCEENKTKLKDEYFWCRGQLDPIILQDLCNKIGEPDLQPSFWMWRDLRTIIHYMYNAPRGYCNINYPDNQIEVDKLQNLKHDPKADVILDVLQLFYGVAN